jgi:hypothetical protein
MGLMNAAERKGNTEKLCNGKSVRKPSSDVSSGEIMLIRSVQEEQKNLKGKTCPSSPVQLAGFQRNFVWYMSIRTCQASLILFCIELLQYLLNMKLKSDFYQYSQKRINKLKN